MSKKCCGMTYFDDETVCSICGKELIDFEDDPAASKKELESDMSEKADELSEEPEDIDPSFVIDSAREAEMAKLTDIIYEEREDEKIEKKGDAPTSLKVVGVISLLLAIVGLALVGVCVYFMVIAPSYDKTKEGFVPSDPVPYIEIATITDSDLEKSEALEAVSTQTDADEATTEDTDVDLSTGTDATASDAE